LANKINEIDKKILHLLSKNPELSQVDLAEHLKISQPAVSARIHKLKEAGALAHSIGLEIKKAQLFLAIIDIATNNTGHVLNSLERCPLYVNGFLTSGRYNLTVLLIGENMRSIVSCVDSHLRPDPIIKEMGFDLVITPVREFIVPIKPILDKKKITPCEKDCSSCAFYKDNRCLGCPASIHYKGTFL
jgi:DNA-binding Lrp family transcriptional regulator